VPNRTASASPAKGCREQYRPALPFGVRFRHCFPTFKDRSVQVRGFAESSSLTPRRRSNCHYNLTIRSSPTPVDRRVGGASTTRCQPVLNLLAAPFLWSGGGGSPGRKAWNRDGSRPRPLWQELRPPSHKNREGSQVDAPISDYGNHDSRRYCPRRLRLSQVDTERPEGDAAAATAGDPPQTKERPVVPIARAGLVESNLTPPRPPARQATCPHLRCNRHDWTLARVPLSIVQRQ
jgi:hypothetical protein